MQRKVDKIKLLLVSCRDSEAKYVVRYAMPRPLQIYHVKVT